MSLDAVRAFFGAVDQDARLQTRLREVRRGHPDDLLTQLVAIAADEGHVFTGDEYLTVIEEEYGLLFKYHRVVFHHHLVQPTA